MKRTQQSRKRLTGDGWSVTTHDREPVAEQPRDTPAGPAVARLRLEKRRGKPVTVAAVEGLEEASLRNLLKKLKTRCGSGGTARPGALELQGDQRVVLREALRDHGLQVKG